MRLPHQVLGFPYKKDKNGQYLYAVFLRNSKKEVWQGIAGGVEDFDKSYLDAFKREAYEEANISFSSKVIPIESICTIPVERVTKKFIFGENTILIYEHSFGVEVTKENIKLSSEHKDMKWLSYEDAIKILTYDSNKNALWELNYKLQREENNMTNSKDYLNKEVEVTIDRKLGTRHPKHGFMYMLNYGYIPNTISGDGEELDAYLVGEFEPVESSKGKVIAIIHRTNDNDDKLIVSVNGKNYTDEQIRALTEFQEQYFESEIWR